MVHFISSFLLAFTGGISGGAAKVAADILLFPLSVIQGGPDGFLFFLVPWILLSLLWGWGLLTLLRVLRQRFKR